MYASRPPQITQSRCVGCQNVRMSWQKKIRCDFFLGGQAAVKSILTLKNCQSGLDAQNVLVSTLIIRRRPAKQRINHVNGNKREKRTKERRRAEEIT